MGRLPIMHNRILFAFSRGARGPGRDPMGEMRVRSDPSSLRQVIYGEVPIDP